jgi:hypothetical protein
MEGPNYLGVLNTLGEVVQTCLYFTINHTNSVCIIELYLHIENPYHNKDKPI